ncbi:hypothetical protein PO909_008283 [Leuciscus waleckii]
MGRYTYVGYTYGLGITGQYNIWDVTEVAPAYNRGKTHRSVTAEGALPRERHRLAAGSLCRGSTVEEYTYVIAIGITTYGPSLAQVPPVHTSARPGSATSIAEGCGGTRQGSA